jgi:acyl-CoA thioesterase I
MMGSVNAGPLHSLGLAASWSSFYLMWIALAGSQIERLWQDTMQKHLGQMVRVLAAVNILLSIFTLPAVAKAKDAPVRIVAFGDSLMAGYMLAEREAFPAQLERKLKAAGLNVEIINAGVSGDTTAGGLARLDWSIPEGTDAVILELGANDAMRGLDPAKARQNLTSIVERLKARDIEILIAGMLAPRNLGETYTSTFNAIFPDLAQKHGALLYPFFLQGVAMRAKLNLGDGIHPNPEGVSVIVGGIVPKVKELIARVHARRARQQGG